LKKVFAVIDPVAFSAGSSEKRERHMDWWMLPSGVMGGYVVLVVGFYLVDRWRRDRDRDKRVAEWISMVREQQREKRDAADDWATRTWREGDKKNV